ncbi:hypothetical protein QQP08_020987, partial [Theobroma cacao]
SLVSVYSLFASRVPQVIDIDAKPLTSAVLLFGSLWRQVLQRVGCGVLLHTLMIVASLEVAWKACKVKVKVMRERVKRQRLKSIFSCLCPCCACCVPIVDMAMSIVKLPVTIIQWFIDLIPC